MGYMGFGMQKWIYQQKPKKPFRKKQLGSSGKSIEQKDTQQLTTSELEAMGESIRHEARREFKRNIRIVVFSVIASVILLYFLSQFIKDFLLKH